MTLWESGPWPAQILQRQCGRKFSYRYFSDGGAFLKSGRLCRHQYTVDRLEGRCCSHTSFIITLVIMEDQLIYVLHVTRTLRL